MNFHKRTRSQFRRRARIVLPLLVGGLVFGWSGPTAATPHPPGVQAGAKREVEIHPGVTMVFRWIPPNGIGESKTGKDRGGGFWMGQFEVTQAQWESVMQYNPSHFRESGPDAPVERVSWDDAQSFIQKLNAHSKLSLRFRLPTDVEWEHACRAGTTTSFHFGDSLNVTQANMNGPGGDPNGGEGRSTTVPVGSYPPNAWGLHDMHGNVWEWCEEAPIQELLDGLLAEPVELPAWLPRVIRGGSWFGDALLCSSAYRATQKSNFRAANIGIRLVMQDGRADESDTGFESPLQEKKKP